MKTLLFTAVLGAAIASAASHAAVITVDALQTGGFYADGSADNSPAFQNYFVGYGTSPGGDRTPERRDFFWFSLAGVTDTIVSATLHLKLVFGGLIFGKGPGDPAGPPVPDDPFETYQLSGTPVPPLIVTSPVLTPAAGTIIFASFISGPTAAPYTFGGGAPPPPPDGHIAIELNAGGLLFLNTHLGSDVVLTGYMPTWTEDARPSPSPPPAFFEASELIFGLTDVPGGVPVPFLTLRTAAVPEPASALLLLMALVFWWPVRARGTARSC